MFFLNKRIEGKSRKYFLSYQIYGEDIGLWVIKMILHIFNNQLKFSKGYFQFLKESCFDLSSTKLIHYGKKNDFFSNQIGIDAYFVRSYISPIGNIRMIWDLCLAKKIIVHSLASPALLFYLTFFPKLQKKVVWIIWGKDLYFYKLLKKKRIYHKIYEWFRRKSIKNIGTIVTSIPEDYDVLKELYDVSGEYIECNVLYPYSFDNTIGQVQEPSQKKTILLGNSSSKSNNHKEAIKVLSNDIVNIKKVYCPLSYGGDEKYKYEVKDYGYKYLKEKFVPLMDFMPIDEYKNILSEVDIGVFNHNRQEGLANIWTLMFLGKTVYLQKNISSAKYFRRVGIKIKYVENIEQEGVICFEKSIIEDNQKRLSAIMNIDNSVYAWKKILSI